MRARYRCNQKQRQASRSDYYSASNPAAAHDCTHQAQTGQ